MSLPANFICPITQDTMKDPVICEDGISYERVSIQEWFLSHNTSPVTRQIIHSTNLIPNIALRNTIQDYLKQEISISTSVVLPALPALPAVQASGQNKVQFTPVISSCYFENNYYSFASLNFKNTYKKPSMIVAVIDTSGSMGENADIPGTESSGLSRLDLVKHALNTIVNALSDNDMICIIKFSNTASVISDFVKLTRYGKDATLENIKRLESDGMTNLWAGLKLGIDKITSNYSDNYNISMLVMTDGVSNSDPPRGIIPTLTEQIKTNKLNFSINTFGYGYNIDSNLLEQISIIGNGLFALIPDATMVGTIFVNIIASILNGCVNNLEIITDSPHVEMLTPQFFGMISVNQPSHIIFKATAPIDHICFTKFNDIYAEIHCISSKLEPTVYQIEQLMRLKLIQSIQNGYVNKNVQELIDLQQQLIQLNTTLLSQYITDIIDDIASVDPNKGQLTKAILRPDWFKQWGESYLKAISRAHKLERCITFKELSPQHYNSNEFKLEQSRIEQIFCDLPAPLASNQVNQVNHSYNTRGGSPQVTPVTQVVSMRSYYTQDGGCFDGNGFVKMYNITTRNIYYKKVNEVIKGDYIYCPINLTKYAMVTCIVRLKVNKKIMMCKYNEMLITVYHPIYHNEKWIFPIDICQPEFAKIDYMYDFVLDSGHVVNINDNQVITLGHGYNFNDVVTHEYFGDKIINDLEIHPGWKSGYIQLDNYKFLRGDNMQINGICF